MGNKSIYVSTPFSSEFDDVFSAILEAAHKAEEHTAQRHEVFRGDQFQDRSSRAHKFKTLKTADLIIADTSGANPHVLFELGVAISDEKPIICINQKEEQFPISIHSGRVILYDRERLRNDLIPHLLDEIITAINEPNQYTASANDNETDGKKPSVFVSYSHVDKLHLERFRVHAKPLEMNGVIDLWVDTSIKAGEKWKEKIEQALSEAAIAVLLISADFLASDFIVNNELPPILEAADKKGTRILPVILKPCRFARDLNLSKFQALNPPSSPLLLMSEMEQEMLWDRLSAEIEVEIGRKS